MKIRTSEENGVRCSVWLGEQVIYIAAQSDDAAKLAELSLQLNERGYNTTVEPITDRVGRFLGAYSLAGEKRVDSIEAGAAV